MQDRFKCRYFHKKQLYDVEMIDFSGRYVYFKEGDNKVCTRVELDFKNLIQCTGLKDKNGKLIYEGDIVKLYNSTYEVVFEKRTAYFGLKISNIETATLNNIDTQVSEIEVIDNIYENPELLEGKANAS